MMLEKYIRMIPESTGWASDEEFRRDLNTVNLREGAAGRGGVVMYSQDGEECVYDGELHTMIFGSTGSGKTRRVIAPTINSILLGSTDSLVVFDPKGELMALTAEAAHASGCNVKVIDLRHPEKSAPWSPLYRANKLWKEGRKVEAYEQIDDISKAVFNDGALFRGDPYWTDMSRGMFNGLSDLLWQTGRKVTVRNILRLRYTIRKDSDGGEAFEKALSCPMDSVAHRDMRGLMDLPEKTRGCILNTFDEHMKVFAGRADVLDMVNGNESIDLDCVGRERTALYLVVPDDRTTLGALQGLILNTLNRDLNDLAMENGGCLPVRTSIIIDELCNIRPAIPDLGTRLSISRSRGMRYVLAAQNLTQLLTVYSDDGDTVLNNCANWMIVYAARDRALLDRASDLCGENAFGEKLITADQLAAMKMGQALIMRERHKPYMTLLEDISVLERYTAGA